MDQLTLLDETNQDERGKVESWRLHVLMEAGYPLPLAERLASSHADLHLAVDLVGRRAARDRCRDPARATRGRPRQWLLIGPCGRGDPHGDRKSPRSPRSAAASALAGSCLLPTLWVEARSPAAPPDGWQSVFFTLK
jgi:hypothetical protein